MATSRSRSASRNRYGRRSNSSRHPPTTSTLATSTPAPRSLLRLRVWHFLLLYFLLPLLLLPGLRNPLSCFDLLNVLICYWETLLLPYNAKIKKDYKGAFLLKYSRLQRRIAAHPPPPRATSAPLLAALLKDPRPASSKVLCFFGLPLPPNPFSPPFWTAVWSTYSLYDDSYANPGAPGFWIDTGNGWSTVLPR